MRHFAQFAPLYTHYQNRLTASACSNWLHWPPRVARVAGSRPAWRQAESAVHSGPGKYLYMHVCLPARVCTKMYINILDSKLGQPVADPKIKQAKRRDSTRRDARAPNTSNFILFPNHNFCLSSVCCLCLCRCCLCCCCRCFCFCLDQFRCRCPMPNAGAGGAAVESG